MVPFGFDQTNGRVDRLGGEDGGVIAPVDPDESIQGFVQRIMTVPRIGRGTSVVDRDPSITAYSEEGVR